MQLKAFVAIYRHQQFVCLCIYLDQMNSAIARSQDMTVSENYNAPSSDNLNESKDNGNKQKQKEMKRMQNKN